MFTTLQALRDTVVMAAKRYVSDPTTASLEHLHNSVRAMDRLEARVEELERQLAAEATKPPHPNDCLCAITHCYLPTVTRDR